MSSKNAPKKMLTVIIFIISKTHQWLKIEYVFTYLVILFSVYKPFLAHTFCRNKPILAQ